MAPSPRSTTLPDGWGNSAEVTTAFTPGKARARLGSMLLMRAWGWGLRRTLPYSRPGKLMSAPYWARPVTLSVPSWRIGLLPTTLNSSVDNTRLDTIM